MILQKNPQLKQEANWIKTLMNQHAYLEEKQTKLVGVDYEHGEWIRKEVETNLLVYKTDRGEYKHPLEMNAEMARRFELIERFSNISDGGSKASDTRALRLQELYAFWKSKPIVEAKYRVRYLKNNHRSDCESNDEVYVITELLKLDPYKR